MVSVTVDWIKCNGDGVYVDVCPVDVFDKISLNIRTLRNLFLSEQTTAFYAWPA